MKLERVDNELVKELNVIVSRELKDPRLNGFISITAVETAKDLKTAKAFVSVMDDDNAATAISVLNGASARIRGILFDRLKIRTVPHITFVKDNSLNHSFRIESILKELHIEENIDDKDDE